MQQLFITLYVKINLLVTFTDICISQSYHNLFSVPLILHWLIDCAVCFCSEQEQDKAQEQLRRERELRRKKEEEDSLTLEQTKEQVHRDEMTVHRGPTTYSRNIIILCGIHNLISKS